MTHLSAQHIIGSRRVAGEVNSIHIGTIAGLDEEGHVDGLVFLVDLWHTRSLSKGIAEVAEKLHHDFFCAGNQTLGIDLTGANEYRRS